MNKVNIKDIEFFEKLLRRINAKYVHFRQAGLTEFGKTACGISIESESRNGTYGFDHFETLGTYFLKKGWIERKDNLKYGGWIVNDDRKVIFDGDIRIFPMYPTINCPICLEFIKKRSYYCNKHGFLSCNEVTFNERCHYCRKDACY